MINSGECYDNLRFGLIFPNWQDNSHLPSQLAMAGKANVGLRKKKKVHMLEKLCD